MTFSPRTARLLFPLSILALGVLAYSNSFSVPFLFDDNFFIQNPVSRLQFWPLWKVFVPPDQYQPWLHRPLINLSLAVNFRWTGEAVWSYHLFNLTVHLLAGLVLMAILRRTVSERLAWAIALLWTVHPLQTESVTYIYQRAESFTDLFYLLALYGLIRSADTHARDRRWPLLTLAACLTGMLGKQMMATAPIALLVYDRIFLAGSWKELWRKRRWLHGGLIATLVIIPILLLSAHNEVPSNAGFSYRGITPWQYARTETMVILHYLRLAFWPHPLVFDYMWPVARATREFLPSLFLIACALLATAWALRRHPAAGFLGFWFFLTLAPISSFIPSGDLAAEHRMYLPLAAVLTGFVLCVKKFLRPRPATAFLALCVVALTWGTWQRNQDYRNRITLWEDTVFKRPNNHRAHANAGTGYLWQNKPEKAQQHFEEALRLCPSYIGYRNSLGLALAARGQFEEALNQTGVSLKIRPTDPETRYVRGHIQEMRGNLNAAAAEYAEMVRLQPNYPYARCALASSLIRQGKKSEALAQYGRAFELDPQSSEDYRFLAESLAKLGKKTEAEVAYEEARRLELIQEKKPSPPPARHTAP